MPETFVALDTETHLIAPYNKVRTAPTAPTLVCLSIAEAQRDADGNGVLMTGVLVPDGDEELSNRLAELLRDDEVVIVGHNLGFDFAVLEREFPDLSELLRGKCLKLQVLDTMVWHALLCPDWTKPRSLAGLCKEYLHSNLEKGAVRTSFRRGEKLTSEQVAYAKQDAVATLALANSFRDKGLGSLSETPGEWRLHSVRTERNPDAPDPVRLYCAAQVLAKMGLECRGLAVDKEKLREYHDAAQEQVLEEMKVLVELGLAEWVRKPGAAPRSEEVVEPQRIRDQLTRRWQYFGGRMARLWKGQVEVVEAVPKLRMRALAGLYANEAERLRLTPPRTPQGQISLEYDYWKQYQADLPESLQTHLRVGKARKLLSTYFAPLLKASLPDRPLVAYPSYGIGLTETARWSCWKPNFQNQPKAIRDMYLAPYQGHVLVGADYSSLELYTLCQCLGAMGIKGPLYTALESEDVHRATAGLIFGKEAADVTKEERQTAKVCNFGIPGGLGPKNFAKYARTWGLEWTTDEARAVREDWFEAYPDVAEYLEQFRVHPLDLRHHNQTRRQFLEQLGFDASRWPSVWEIQDAMNEGKLYRCTLPSGRVVANRRYAQALNLFFQGTGADVITLAYLEAERVGLGVCAVVHDSITVSAWREEAEQVARQLEEVMTRAHSVFCPLAPQTRVVAEIAERWF